VIGYAHRAWRDAWPWLVLAVSAAVAGVSASPQNATFSSKVDSVRVDVLAMDSGKPIAGLGAADFEILDNGVPQQVDLVSFDQIPLKVILALDMSDSVVGDRLESLRSAGRGLVEGLTKDDQAALITFSKRVRLGAGLTTDPSRVRSALDATVGSGNTALIDGAYAALALSDSDAGRALVIVFSDGLDTSSWLTAQTVLDAATRSDAVVYGVTVQSRAKPEFLRDLTTATAGRLFEVEKTANLRSIFLSVLDEFRHRYVVNYTPRGVATSGWHTLEVRIKNRKATIKARPGYLAGS
jgi:VWFA-related protein